MRNLAYASSVERGRVSWAVRCRYSRGGVPLALWLALSLGLTACGGGGGGSPAVAVSAPAQATGSIIVRATTTAGSPVAGAGIDLNGGFDGRSTTTDANGEALFKDVPAGEASVNAWMSGYRLAGQGVSIAKDTVNKVTVILEDVITATPVVLTTHSVASIDGRTLVVEADIAVLGENGEPIETLTASEFSVFDSSRSFWGWFLVADAEGNYAGGFNARLDTDRFSFVPARARPAVAAAVVLEQSAEVASFDPTGLRLHAVNAFFDSVNPPDTVALASYAGAPGTSGVTTYGGFTSDAASLRIPLNALAGQERGTNSLYGAVTEMISFTAANTAVSSSALRRAVVVVTSGWPKGECNDLVACKRAMVAATGPAIAKGVAVAAIGAGNPAAEMAARTGGAFVFVEYPAQLPVVFKSLMPIAARSLAYNRVTFTLDAGQPGVFKSGNTVYAYASVRIGPQTQIMFPVVVPI